MNKEPAQKVLVTGCHGFIARNFIEYLHFKGYQTKGIDRYGIADPMQLQLDINNFLPDYIVHTSAYGNHSDQDDEYEMLGANIVILQFLLESTKPIPYKGFLNISSSSVYGKKDHPMREDENPETTTMYGATKLSGEYICRAYAKKYKLPIVNMRPFSVYGRWEQDKRLIPRTISSILKGETMRLDPSPKHDWVYIDDVCTAMEALMLNAQSVSGEAFNVCTGEQWSNEQVVERVEWVMDRCCVVSTDNAVRRPYDTSNSWVGDNSKMKSLGWQPEFDLMKGLRKTARIYEKEFNKK